MLPLPLFLQHVADTVPAHPDSSHFEQSSCAHRRQIFEPQQIPSPAGGGFPAAQSQSGGGGGGGVPLDPPLDELPPPSPNWTSGTEEQAEASMPTRSVSPAVIAPTMAAARRVPVTRGRLTQNVPDSPNIAPPRT